MDENEEECPSSNAVRDKQGRCWKDFVGYIKSDLAAPLLKFPMGFAASGTYGEQIGGPRVRLGTKSRQLGS